MLPLLQTHLRHKIKCPLVLWKIKTVKYNFCFKKHFYMDLTFLRIIFRTFLPKRYACSQNDPKVWDPYETEIVLSKIILMLIYCKEMFCSICEKHFGGSCERI